MSSKIYLISPPEIAIDNFSSELEAALGTKKVPVFQLRLKGYEDEQIINIGKRLLKICNKYQTLFILNDRLDLALKIGANGVHFGDSDGNILEARKIAPENFVIGASCYDSKHLAVCAAEDGANYVSFGTFFDSPTKNSKGKPSAEILKWCDEFLNVQTVAIGGITAKNCQELVEARADFLAVISYVWNNKDGVKKAIEDLAGAVPSSVSNS
jgi:thiamine-phosphate pyrophosphorylase